MPLTLVSGGQSGVDRAALDAALAWGLEAGGWCPRGRWAEDGPIPARYPLRETPSADPAQRTRWNVRDSDATLIVAPAPLAGGTALTLEAARALGRPHRVSTLGDADALAAARWLREGVGLEARLNVAGPRESEAPGIYRASRRWFETVLEALYSEGARK